MLQESDTHSYATLEHEMDNKALSQIKVVWKYGTS